jgi:hypothetical protein
MSHSEARLRVEEARALLENNFNDPKVSAMAAFDAGTAVLLAILDRLSDIKILLECQGNSNA